MYNLINRGDSRGGENPSDGCIIGERLYPRSVAHTCCNLSGKATERVEEQPKATISLPHVRGISVALKRVLEPIEVSTILKPNQTLMKKLEHPNDVPDIKRSNVVYHIPCVNCHATYKGETNRELDKRVDEHMKATQRAEVEVSALAKHVWKFEHRVD